MPLRECGPANTSSPSPPASQRIRQEQSALNSELERKKHELAAEQARQQELMQQLDSLQQNFIASNPEKGEEEARLARQEVRARSHCRGGEVTG